MIPFYPEPSSRETYGLPNARCLNVYYEKTPQGPGEYAMLSRPGLEERFSVGKGPIKGLFRAPGVENNAIFAVSGSHLYRRVKNSGVEHVTGGFTADRVRFAASDDQLVVIGGTVKVYNGSTVSNVPDLSSVDVSDVAELGQRFYYAQRFTDTVWFSALGDATDVDSLNFFTVEEHPDAVVGMVALNGEMVFFGRKSFSIYSQTGDADAPLATAPGRGGEKGCLAQDSIVKIDNSVIWVSHEGIVVRLSNIPKRISTHWIESHIRLCEDQSDIRSWELIFDGHTFYVMTIPGRGTFLYDIGEDKWTQWASWNRVRFRIRCGICFDGENWLGDDVFGQIWRLRSDKYKDEDDPIQRVVSTAVPQPSGNVRCDVVGLQCVRGQGSNLDRNPQVEMRYSNDAGNTWSKWRSRDLGAKGEFDTKAIWRCLGLISSPGRGFEFRTSAPVKVAFQYITVNEQRP